MKPERADIIEKAIDYLMHSNFYALHHSLKNDFDIKWSWIKQKTMKILADEVYQATGTRED